MLKDDKEFLDKIKESCSGTTTAPETFLIDNAIKKNEDVKNNSSVTKSPSNNTKSALDHSNLDETTKCRFSLKPPTLKKTTHSSYSNHPNNYLKGCKFSPDGLALLTCSNDNILRFYGVPDISSPSEQCPTVCHQMSGLIYDYCWSPYTNHFQPETCNILATSKDNPVHLIDGFTGKVKSSYKSFDKADELTSAFSVAFSTDCCKILAGFCKEIRVFDVNQPGRESERMVVSVEGLNNNSIVSTIVPHPTTQGLYGAGCYNSYVSLYSENVCGPVASFEGPQNGVTQLMFSDEGSKLFCGSRMENEIYCFDTRWTNKVLFTLTREVCTNQRIYFDIDKTGSVLVSGNHSGEVTIYDLTSPLSPPLSFTSHNDTCNGVSLHPYWTLLATSSGRRHCHVGGEEEEENTLKIWSFSE